MIVTQWFTSDIKPKHIGVYERLHPTIPTLWPYSYWDGKRWGLSVPTAIDAMLCRRQASSYQKANWRGIAK